MRAGVGGLPSGTVTFLFTDIEGSTRLWDEHPEMMRLALARHDDILRAVIQRHGGFVFSTGGDGVAAAFRAAGDAGAAAVGAQRALLAEPWVAPVELRVRMGLHTGEAHERDGDYFGPPVNRAARIMATGHGGQILMSSVTRELVGPSAELELHDLGSHVLRGVTEPVHLFGVSADGVVWLDRPLVTGTWEPGGNLPRPVSDWIGSVAELRRRAAELPRRRLVTLTGSGGIGKTRTAIEIAWLATDEYPAGVWFVELAAVADPSSVLDAIAATMTLRPQPGMSTLEAVVDGLHGRKLLLVLDNCEHVLTPVAELVAAVASRCETVTVLATSREPLGVAGERVAAVPSLPVADAVELFCDRARAADDTIRFDSRELDAVEAICRRLDGIPLAIELAAARIRSLVPTELLPLLDDRFRLLRGAGRGGLERHQTLRATVDWSYQLLSEPDQLLFDRTSVFAGTFGLSAVQAVCADGTIDDLDIIDLMASLVDRSMVIAERNAIGTRYRLLETLRQFGEEHTDARGETARLRDRHLAHYVAAARDADRRRASPEQFAAEESLAADWDNLRAALDWAITTNDLDAAQAIVAAAGQHSRARMRAELGEWSQRCLDALGDPSNGCPTTFAWAAYWKWIPGDVGAAAELARQGIDAAPDRDHPDTALCWPFLVLWSLRSTDRTEVAPAVDHAIHSGAANPDPFIRAWVLNGLLQAAFVSGSDHTWLLSRYAHLADEIGAPSLRAGAEVIEAQSLGWPWGTRDPAALEATRIAIEQARCAGDVYWEGLGLNLYALNARFIGAADAAAASAASLRHLYGTRNWGHLFNLLGDISSQPDDVGYVVLGWLEGLGDSGGLRAALVEAARQSPGGIDAMARGAAMDRDELVAYLLDRLEGA
jgi:predicted ATPase/class 3 adenylate cyclase